MHLTWKKRLKTLSAPSSLATLLGEQLWQWPTPPLKGRKGAKVKGWGAKGY